MQIFVGAYMVIKVIQSLPGTEIQSFIFGFYTTFTAIVVKKIIEKKLLNIEEVHVPIFLVFNICYVSGLRISDISGYYHFTLL